MVDFSGIAEKINHFYYLVPVYKVGKTVIGAVSVQKVAFARLGIPENAEFT